MLNFEISLTNNQKIFPVNSEEIEKNLKALAKHILEFALKNEEILKDSVLKDYNLSNKTISVDILLTDDKKIQALNTTYRGKDKSTDVLSFALFADSSEKMVSPEREIALGEVIISVETAKKQADDNKIELKEEINFLLCHGILHLMGFDHPDEESLEWLLNIQNEILSAIKE